MATCDNFYSIGGEDLDAVLDIFDEEFKDDCLVDDISGSVSNNIINMYIK